MIPRIMILIFFAHVAIAKDTPLHAQIFLHQPHHKIKAIIGDKSQNRISFEPAGIREIVGDDSAYQVLHDRRGHNVFIAPKVQAGHIIEMTLISNGGKVQDISLKVVDGYGQAIIIKHSPRGQV